MTAVPAKAKKSKIWALRKILFFFVSFLLASSLWLNEGFARYMQGFGAQHAQTKDTGIIDRLVTTSTLTVMDKGEDLLTQVYKLLDGSTYPRRKRVLFP